jgi:drug/metabolite transporter (DMT)-like permease
MARHTAAAGSGPSSGFSAVFPSGSGMLYLGLLFSSAVWGTQFVLVKLLVTGAPSATLVFARTVLATVCFVSLAATLPHGRGIKRADYARIGVFSLLGSVIYQGCFFAGLQYASASEGAILLPTTNPLFTVLLARLVGQEAPTRQQVLGMLVSLLGVALVFEAAQFDTTAGPSRLIGDGLFLISSMAWAGQSVLGRPLFAAYGPVRTLTVSGLMGLVPLALLSTFAGDNSALGRFTMVDWSLIAALALFSAFAAFVLFNRAVVVIGASAAARFNNLIPVWGIAAAIPILGERPPVLQLCGGGLIVLGVWASTSKMLGRATRRLTQAHVLVNR